MVEIAQNLFSSRRRSLVMGGAAAALAAIVLGVYLHNYRNSVNGGAVTAPVLVAKNLIPKGTSGDTIASSSQYQVAQLPRAHDVDRRPLRHAVLGVRDRPEGFPRLRIQAVE